MRSSASPRLAAGLPGLDVRSGPGQYVVAAPSRHVSGATYESDGAPIAPLPDWATVELRHTTYSRRHGWVGERPKPRG